MQATAVSASAEIEDNVGDRSLAVRAIRAEQLDAAIVLEWHEQAMTGVLTARKRMQVANCLPPVHCGDDLGVAHAAELLGVRGFCQRATRASMTISAHTSLGAGSAHSGGSHETRGMP